MYIHSVEVHNVSEEIFHHYVYDKRGSAISAAIDVMIEEMKSWVPSTLSEKEKKIYNEIVDLVHQKKYEDALNKYNNIPIELQDGSDKMHTYILVINSVAISYPDVQLTIDSIPDENVSVAPTISEAPCNHCKRMNYTGVNECWCCGNVPF